MLRTEARRASSAKPTELASSAKPTELASSTKLMTSYVVLILEKYFYLVGKIGVGVGY